MRPALTTHWLALVLVSAFALGCRTASRGPSYPADPLFAIKKPELAKAADAAPRVVARTSPEVPAVPPVILAARQTPRPPTTQPGSVPEQGEYRVGYPPNSSSP